jgi:cyclic dehypoxanthinyl futalosine synthase
MSSKSISYLLGQATNGERLYFDEAVRLYTEADLAALGRAASAVRQRRVPGRIATYLVDRHINYTNVCNTSCQFCGFHRPPGHSEGFVVTREDLTEKIDELLDLGGTRIFLQGGHNPDLKLEWYTDLLHWLKDTYPTIERDCFGPTEISHIARVSNMSVREVLIALKDAGLQGLPGTGADMLDDDIRIRFSPKKPRSESWLSVMREAHKLGLNTTATMVIGFKETPEQRVRHMQRLRSLQDYSLREHGHGFNAFVCWTLQHSELSSLGRSSTNGYGTAANDYLRHVAIARLFLDNILHHEASWATQGIQIGQASLDFGLDDFGGTMFAENVYSASTYQTYSGLSEQTIHSLVREAGYTPARRDTAYNLLHIFDDEHELANVLPDDAGAAQRTHGEVIPLHVRLN